MLENSSFRRIYDENTGVSTVWDGLGILRFWRRDLSCRRFNFLCWVDHLTTFAMWSDTL